MATSDTDNDSEYVVSTATYKGFMITCTNWGNFTVLIYTIPYPAIDLSAAKSMIDRVFNVRKN